jgi:hypothetical protein
MIRKYIFAVLRGRVGYGGQCSLDNFGANLNDAKRSFCQKYVYSRGDSDIVIVFSFFSNRFKEKTRNDFYHRDTFTKYPGKYDYVQLDYNPSVS